LNLAQAKETFRRMMEKARAGKLSDADRRELQRANAVLRQARRPAMMNSPKKATLEDAARDRLSTIGELVRSGATEMVGKTRREYVGAGHDKGKIVGRFGGGMSREFPELARSGVSPAGAARAIARGKGRVYARLLKASKAQLSRAGFKGSKRRAWTAGAKTVAPHAKVTGKCTTCGVAHAKGPHRFHGAGSYHQTHLFSFNPAGMIRLGRVVELRYKREIGKHRGFYKHPFTSKAVLYYVPASNTILIRES
jgi:hypothetical protein